MASAEYFGGFFWNVFSRPLCKESSLEGFKGGGGGMFEAVIFATQNDLEIYFKGAFLILCPFIDKKPHKVRRCRHPCPWHWLLFSQSQKL